ncbi:hypothetical protein [Parapedobacter sp. DT-150]|uniref:hypothetical protein n=1 Tax=Parapedobacter sp. DT-150 TaxID=3396162 RepID=UPI003F1CC13A
MKTRHSLRLLAAAIIMMMAYSCRNETREDAEEIAKDAVSPSLPYIAFFDAQSEQLEARKNPAFDHSLLNVDALTQALITNYPEITPKVAKIANDTLYLEITDAQYLTQQMGSSGAQMYLLEATYAYTELTDINAVHFSFKEGDHASPGTFTRAHFETVAPVH